jgi:biopolymer transport protein ExbB/TolQ
MKSNLNLTVEQVAQVHPINLKYADKMQDLYLSSQTRRQKFQALKADFNAKDAELKKIFTADQYKTYQAKKEEIKKALKDEMKERKSTR